MKKYLIIWVILVNLLIGVDTISVKNPPDLGKKEVIATVQVKIIIPAKDKQKNVAIPDTIKSQDCETRLLTEENN